MNNKRSELSSSLSLRAGEWVTIRAREEILASLDESGRIDQMPFMPEMLKHCGQRHRVSKRAHKTCDPVNGLEGRRLVDSVHLEGLRCDGSAHGGCEAACLLFWKEAWLTRGGTGEVEGPAVDVSDAEPYSASMTDQTLDAATTDPEATRVAGETVYVCQATKLADATQSLAWWDLTQYFEDLRSGNVSLAQMLRAICMQVYQFLAESGLGVGSFLRGVYDYVQMKRGGVAYPFRKGRVPKGQKTPTASLGLQSGDLVRMKSFDEILSTLDATARNRGLYFDAEMVPYCNGIYRVLKRLERIIDEKSGKMLHFKSDVILLDGVVCQARYAKYRKFCPRGYYQYAREVWLEKVQS